MTKQLTAHPADRSRDRRPAQILRMVLAGTWLTIGVTNPTPAGVVALVFGGVFAGLVIAEAHRTARLHRARVRLAALRSTDRRHDI